MNTSDVARYLHQLLDTWNTITNSQQPNCWSILEPSFCSKQAGPIKGFANIALQHWTQARLYHQQHLAGKFSTLKLHLLFLVLEFYFSFAQYGCSFGESTRSNGILHSEWWDSLYISELIIGAISKVNNVTSTKLLAKLKASGSWCVKLSNFMNDSHWSVFFSLSAN